MAGLMAPVKPATMRTENLNNLTLYTATSTSTSVHVNAECFSQERKRKWKTNLTFHNLLSS